MKIQLATVAAMAMATALAADPASARDAFLKQQAYAEMQRVSGQIDVVQSNVDELAERLRRLEGSRDEIESLKAEIAGLKATNAELRNSMQSMRDEIVRDLTGKLSAMQKTLAAQQAPSAPPPPRQSASPHREYEVQPGDTLSLIAAAFKTSVQKIKEMNGLKSDGIRVGQKLKLPL